MGSPTSVGIRNLGVVALKTGWGFASSLSPPGTMVVTVQMSGLTTAFSGFRQKVLPHK